MRSLIPKFELFQLILRHQIDLAYIIKTWLKESVDENVISNAEHTVFCKDRKTDNHGGLCIYVNVKQLRSFKPLEDLNC